MSLRTNTKALTGDSATSNSLTQGSSVPSASSDTSPAHSLSSNSDTTASLADSGAAPQVATSFVVGRVGRRGAVSEVGDNDGTTVGVESAGRASHARWERHFSHLKSSKSVDQTADTAKKTLMRPTRGKTTVTPSTTTTATTAKPSAGSLITAEVRAYRSRKKLGKRFTEYKVCVTSGPLEWAVWKRYNEFRGMHEKLEQFIAERNVRASDRRRIAVPKFPPRKLFGNLNENFITMRRFQLGVYVSACMKVDDIATSHIMLDFLGALSVKTTQPLVKRKESNSAGQRRELYLDKFLELARSGDVLLFHTQGMLSGLQRRLFSSDFDHVGIIVRVPCTSRRVFDLFVLEATIDGVHLYPLKSRMRSWNLSKAIVVWRQLMVKRTFGNMKALEKFAEEVNGKPYSLTPMKLMRSGAEDKKQNYFCSELVASGLREMQALPPDVSSTKYLPAMFGAVRNAKNHSIFEKSHKQLRFTNGASLGAEVLIRFVKPGVVYCRNKQGRSSLSWLSEDDKEVALNLANPGRKKKQQQQARATERKQTDATTSDPTTTTAGGEGGGEGGAGQSVSVGDPTTTTAGGQGGGEGGSEGGAGQSVSVGELSDGDELEPAFSGEDMLVDRDFDDEDTHNAGEGGGGGGGGGGAGDQGGGGAGDQGGGDVPDIEQNEKLSRERKSESTSPDHNDEPRSSPADGQQPSNSAQPVSVLGGMLKQKQVANAHNDVQKPSRGTKSSNTYASLQPSARKPGRSQVLEQTRRYTNTIRNSISDYIGADGVNSPSRNV